MRQRWQNKLRKRLRQQRPTLEVLTAILAAPQRKRQPLATAPREIALDPAQDHTIRREAVHLLLHAADLRVVSDLMDLFLTQTDQRAIWDTALSMESLHSGQLARRLVLVLRCDSNAPRRHTAARALGWKAHPRPTVAKALAACLADPLQPLSVREEAAESRAYVGNRQTLSTLIDALQHQHPGLRFWAAFVLGGSGLSDIRAIQALESVLGDPAIPQGNWWSVGREALAMLGTAWPPIGHYRQILDEAIQQVQQDPAATASERRWAEGYRD